MPCGCSGSKANAPQQQKQQTRRQQRELRRPAPPTQIGDGGFTWNGPRTAPAK